ncbi:uncharacterized protein LOC135385506 isoform X2 [Ornithodoros turicata]|uniref:uncharacterized protein LOC135385506 isoform X2 n=1 Tax=Ornithodoros turicata TaxID=34597 RepID=UPI0031398CAE
MRMVATFLVSSIAVGIVAAVRDDSSSYVDQLISVAVPRYLRAYHPQGIPLEDFRFTVPRSEPGKPGMRAEFHNGKLTGLVESPGLERLGFCSSSDTGDDAVSIRCYLTLDNLKVLYDGSTKGDDINRVNKSISVEARFVRSNAYLEIVSEHGSSPVLKTWTLMPPKLRLSYSRSLHLNVVKRRQNFDVQIHLNIQEAVSAAFYGTLRDALESVISTVPLPLV